MFKNSNVLFIGLSAIALALLLGIQISWLFKTAQAKEDLFREKANMVLSRTAQELCADKQTCEKMSMCCMEENGKDCKLELGKSEARKIDSLLNYFMGFYNFHIDFSYEVIQRAQHSKRFDGNEHNGNVFKKRLEEIAYRNGLELKLILPQRRAFIIEEMGVLFLSSILLIVVVFILFIKTIKALVNEKKLAQRTSDFLNNMTHEFKTPLTNIALAGKLLLRENNIKQEDKIRHYSSIILAENEKLSLQVEQVLSLTALEKGEIPLDMQRINMHDVIQNAVKCISVQTENVGGNLVSNLMATRSFVLGDKAHLSNVVCNLIDNAIKYSKGQPWVSIETKNEGDYFVCSITDKGIGIDANMQQKVFEKYYRVPTGNIHDVKGFGLGLAYVKKMVELHGGEIALTSDLGKGTCVTLKLKIDNE
jgi:two-component system phosphate regulon sensor histidine kinase PhoR